MQQKVIILGGGVAGLSAAHELIERGFAVEVYEAKQIPGGKARSLPVPNTGRGGRKDLPGEHGFRFFPRFYRHVVDTMARIPLPDGRVVSDNLTDTTRAEMARYGMPSLIVPTRSPRDLSDARVLLSDALAVFGTGIGVPRDELAFFGSRIWQIITSCEERRMEQYEKMDWWDFIGADDRSDGYQKFLGYGITRSLVAAKARLASTKTIGDIFVQLLFDIVEPGPSSDRLLNGPTNDVWIDPWLDYLTRRGLRYHYRAKVLALNMGADGRLASATIGQDGRTFDVRGDHYVCAVPVERMSPLLTPALIAAEPSLAGIRQLSNNGVSWMVGVQFYLTQDVPLTHGHTIYVDSPWALTSVSQKQFWPGVDLAQYADGTVKGIISVDISEWQQKGFNGKTAAECSTAEIKAEVWEQLKRSLNVGGEKLLRDEYLHEFFLAPDIYKSAAGMTEDDEPLLVNLIDTWRFRPEAVTAIPNLFLASDYVRTYTDLATMEGANEAARRAVNGILDAASSSAPRCRIWNLHEPIIFEPWRAIDRIRYQQGLPWDDTLVTLGLAAVDIAEKTTQMLQEGFTRGLGPNVPMLPGAAMGLDPATARQDMTQRIAQTIEQYMTQMDRQPATVEHGPTPARTGLPSLLPPRRSGRVRILPD